MGVGVIKKQSFNKIWKKLTMVRGWSNKWFGTLKLACENREKEKGVVVVRG